MHEYQILHYTNICIRLRITYIHIYKPSYKEHKILCIASAMYIAAAAKVIDLEKGFN